MSLLRADYLDHLREQMDEDEDDIPAEEMTLEVQAFCDRAFDAALATPAKKIKPVRKGTGILPGPLRVAVYLERFAKGQALFSDLDIKPKQVKAKGGKVCTKRHPKNGNALEHDWKTEKEILDGLRTGEAERKAVRDAKAWWREIVADMTAHLRADAAARKARHS